MSKGELRGMVLRMVPRLQKPALMPSDDKSLRRQANLREQAAAHLKELGR